MTNVSAETQSKIGLVSCLIGIFNLIYAGFWVLAALNYHHWYPDFLFGGPGGIFAVVTLPIIFLVIPVIGNGIGLIVGVVGLSEPNQRKSVVTIGLILNSIVPIAMLIIFLKVFYFSEQPI